MLDRIKSSNILKIIFYNLECKEELEIIKYNKNIQNKLGISIIDYRSVSKKYKIAEKNGHGKEYDYNDKLIFKGEYLNGKRNGKGKEYDYDNIIFDGEYSDGKRSGKGKEYNSNNILLFEGEYLEGKRNGKGKEYDSDYNLIFDGKFINGKKWNGIDYDVQSKIICKIKNGNRYINEFDNEGNLIFEGEYKNGEKNGKGKEYFEDGKIKF